MNELVKCLCWLSCVVTDQPETKKVATNDGKQTSDPAVIGLECEYFILNSLFKGPKMSILLDLITFVCPFFAAFSAMGGMADPRR